MLLDEIRQMQRTSQPRRPRANDQYIRFELFAIIRHVAILSDDDKRLLRQANTYHITARVSASGGCKMFRTQNPLSSERLGTYNRYEGGPPEDYLPQMPVLI